MRSDRVRLDWVVGILLAISGVLLFSSLENGYLWQDEAETALLARHTLRFGYPRAFDGRNSIEILSHGYGPGDAWIYSPWLPYYLLAGVFAIAGESTWIARLPFALFGLLSIYLTWRLASSLTEDLRIQQLSVALLTFSVPFLLHMRQCRYYAMTTALLLGICLAYLKFLQRPSRKPAVILGLLLTLLFHTNFGTFIPVAAALMLHQAVVGPRPAGQNTFRVMMAVVGGVTLPWALFSYRPAFVGTISWARLSAHTQYYVRVINSHFVPMAAMLIVSLGWWLWTRRRASSPASARRVSPTMAFFMLFVGVFVAFLLVPDQRHLRYLLPVLPLLFIGEAWWLAACYERSRVVGIALMGLALFTRVLHGALQVPLVDLAYELTHRYVGPMEGIVGYLREHGRPGQVVKIPYDDRTVMFYTQMVVERPSEFLQETSPDWLVIRRGRIPEAFFSSAYFHRIETTYERIELDAPDAYWQNREEPGEHHFWTMWEAPPVVLYRKRDAT
ncbi:MAG: glycosyltransferase family 39 protein [Candidatus Omnitrophica bacterium]|nr:glycosyltransferase family 39 protein [Candidatus Omnitrophota bacterium]